MGERAAIWRRVSSGGQDEANQEPDTERYCQERGYEVVERYVVHARSAFHGRHQADIDRALADMQAGKYTVLVVWHSDRLERREGKALLDLLAQFHAAGGRIESVQEPTLGQLDFGGQVMTFITGLMNHEKSLHISEQVKIAHDRIRANGAALGRPPWGYVSAGEKYNRTIIPTAEGKRYIPEIFQRVADGESLESVCAWLRTEVDRKWWTRSLWVIIRNPSYCGRRTNSQGVTVAKCEALVDADLWLRANKALVAKPGRRGPASGDRAMLTSVLFCGDCADNGITSPMYRIRGGNKRKWTYYYCRGTGSERRSCGLLIPLAETDATVVDWLSTLSAPRMVPTLIKGSSHYAELADIQIELAELPRRGLSDDDEDAERARLRAERKRLEALKDVPDRIEMRPSSESVGVYFRSLDDVSRRAWMLADDVKVFARRDKSMPLAIHFGSDEFSMSSFAWTPDAT